MDDLVYRVLVAREASNVRRTHTLPHHGDYTVGKHTHDMMSLLFILHPNPSISLIKTIHHHDIAERWFGDMPATVKWFDTEIDNRLSVLEAEHMSNRGWVLPELTEDEYLWLHALDKLELWLWCHDQMSLGNQGAYSILKNVELWFSSHQSPAEIPMFMKSYNWYRTEELTKNE